jgi:hypothetical protein
MIGKPGPAYNAATMRFELGDSERPRGHAILYFRDPTDAVRVWATYLVIPPIAMDLSKYVPPLLAAQLPAGLAGMAGVPNVYPLPPFPEAVPSLDGLRQLARSRGDDLLDGGALPTSDLPRLMLAVSEAGERYTALYEQAQGRPAPEPPADEAPPPERAELDVDAILLDVMTASEKIGRLARALGSLRYAVDGGDAALARETLAEMEKVARRLDAKYRADELLAAAQEPGPRGGLLAQLYVERCYKLASEDYAAVADLERRISAARAGG